MTEELEHETILTPGFHATAEEIEFTNSVIERIRKEYRYLGPVRLIGGRAEKTPFWLSRKIFHAATDKSIALPEQQQWLKEQQQWLTWLNARAKELLLPRNRIVELADVLPHTAPISLAPFLFGSYGVPGSDIDISLPGMTVRPKNLPLFYEDQERTGQLVDIFVANDPRFQKFPSSPHP